MKTWSTVNGYKITQLLSGRSNVFLLSGSRSNILIDTSPGFMWKNLQDRLNTLNIKRIDLLVLTHSHFDHAANAANIKDKYNAKVIIHKSETGYLGSGDNILPVGINAFLQFMVRSLEKQFRSIARYQPCDNDLTFEERYFLPGFGYNTYLIHTPGHTEGSTSLIIDNDIALVGDTMFGIFPWSVFPPFAADQNLLLDSWKKLLETNCKIFIPSHGSAIKRSFLEKVYRKRSTSRDED